MFGANTFGIVYFGQPFLFVSGNIHNVTSSGGISFDGNNQAILTLNVTATGGLNVEGNAAFSLNNNISSDGGINLFSDITIVKQTVLIVGGPFILSGEANIGNPYYYLLTLNDVVLIDGVNLGDTNIIDGVNLGDFVLLDGFDAGSTSLMDGIDLGQSTLIDGINYE